MSYSIELSNGAIIENLKMNCNNFISHSPLDKKTFENNMSPVIISSDDSESNLYITLGTHPNMDLVQLTHEEGSDEWWFVLRDVSEAELQYAQIRSDIEYLAMMTDVEL